MLPASLAKFTINAEPTTREVMIQSICALGFRVERISPPGSCILAESMGKIEGKLLHIVPHAIKKRK